MYKGKENAALPNVGEAVFLKKSREIYKSFRYVTAISHLFY